MTPNLPNRWQEILQREAAKNVGEVLQRARETPGVHRVPRWVVPAVVVLVASFSVLGLIEQAAPVPLRDPNGPGDTGLGMDPEQVERMFSPFAQGEATLARTRGGLGLGLARGLAELHGGTLVGKSEGLQRGSEFVVTLPVAVVGDPAPQEAVFTPPAPIRVLVIEDNADAAETLAEVLRFGGHDVHVARDGRTGIELARQLRPQVLICDLGLPDIAGYDVARTLRAEEATRSTRLVALSGYVQPADRERAKEAGFDAHLAKPAPPAVLYGTLAPLV